MDPLSITTGCVSLAGTIARISIQITKFVQNLQEARADMDGISRELISLNAVLGMLADDTKVLRVKLPGSVKAQISGIISNCMDLLDQLEKSLKRHQKDRLGLNKWVLWREEDMEKYRNSLIAHTGALDLALEVMTFSIAQAVKTDTQAIRGATAKIHNEMQQSREDILAEIAELQTEVARIDTHNGITHQNDTGPNFKEHGFILQKYLDNMTAYVETAYARSVIDWSSDIEDDYTAVPSDAETEKGSWAQLEKFMEEVQPSKNLSLHRTGRGDCKYKIPANCQLTSTGVCCACADARPISEGYEVYQDGTGMIFTTKWWIHYCPSCKDFWERGGKPAPPEAPQRERMNSTPDLKNPSTPDLKNSSTPGLKNSSKRPTHGMLTVFKRIFR